jgi:hypothetical protein
VKLEKIITLASTPVRLRLLAMVRSLRAVGCDLPVWVIPFSDAPEQRFPLPDGCVWWQVPEVCAWLDQTPASPLMRRYQCFLESNYHFVDTDVIFLRDPCVALAELSGFITSCGHWHNPDHTQTTQSEALFRRVSTTWQRLVFNSGQFACDRPLFLDVDTLRRAAEDPAHISTCFYALADQAGVNLLRLVSGVPLTNVTMPPMAMESTWAGDYADAEYGRYWLDEARRPYLIHWAGTPMHEARPIHELFYRHLTATELEEWHAQVRVKSKPEGGLKPRLHRYKRQAQRVWDALVDD